MRYHNTLELNLLALISTQLATYLLTYLCSALPCPTGVSPCTHHRWLIYPPHYMMMSSKQIMEFFETDRLEFEGRGIYPRGCTQVAGDVMIIPESWAHGVLNIQDCVAVATEVKAAMWRIKPVKKLMDKYPDDNRANAGKKRNHAR